MPVANIEDVLRCTAFVSADKENEPGYGTAFFFDLRMEDGHTESLLVTCRHVVEGTKEAKLRLTRCYEGKRQPTAYCAYFVADDWIYHPDSAVDLAAISLTTWLKSREGEGYVFLHPAVTSDMIPAEGDVAPGDEVLLVGYPNRLRDRGRNLPILSRGIAATHPLVSFDENRRFLINGSAYGGSSGSPVFAYDSVKGKDASPKFLGVLQGGPALPYEGTIGPKAERMTIRLPMNFAYVTLSAQLKRFLEHPRDLEPLVLLEEQRSDEETPDRPSNLECDL